MKLMVVRYSKGTGKSHITQESEGTEHRGPLCGSPVKNKARYIQVASAKDLHEVECARCFRIIFGRR